MELNAINPWLVRPANELKFSVPVCSSHVKRVLTRSDCADLDANDDFVLIAAMPTGPHVERATSCGDGGENRL